MTRSIFLMLTVCLLVSCNKKVNESTDSKYLAFGNKIDLESAISINEMKQKYSELKLGDTIYTKTTGVIKDVCSAKGCWMTIDIGNDEEIMVKFKDYGFFMPLDAKGEVTINGKAFVNEVSIDELQHYAKDSGKSEEEIQAISKSKKVFSFEADGVLLKQ